MRVCYVEISRRDEGGRLETSIVDAGPDAAVFYLPRWRRLVIQGPKINIIYERVISVSIVSIDSEEEADSDS